MLLHLHLCAARRGFVFAMMLMMSRPVADGGRGGDVALTGVKWQLGLVVVVWGGEFQSVGDLALGHEGGGGVRSYIFNN